MTIIELMETAAKKAGQLLLQKYRSNIQVDFKSPREPVTEVDRASEEIIVSLIKKHFPEHEICSEETKTSMSFEKSKKIPLWFVDPLDGTANFVHGINIFCVGIAFYDCGAPEAGLIFDPVHDELFTTMRGKGAYLNGRPIKVSEKGTLLESILATGFPYERKSGNDNTDHVVNFVPLISDLRRTASGLIDAAYVACGRFDGYFEHGLGPWDTAPGVLLIEEAGGRVSDYHGKTYNPFKRDLCAANTHIHKDILQVLSRGTSGL